MRQCGTLARLLQRCEVDVPTRLLAMRDQYQELREAGKASQLCAYFKAFGYCRDEKTCAQRHTVCETLDGPRAPRKAVKIPLEGEVKVGTT